MAQQLSRPTRQIGVGGLELGPRERFYLEQVIASSRLSYGPVTQRFESLFAELHDVRHAIFCSSGTAALQLAVAALKELHGWQDGDEVLVPSVTFVATSNVLLHANLRPVFVDVDPLTYNMDPALVEDRITDRTRAVLPVHLLGLPADMDAIEAVARPRGLRVIEDSCETMFATCRGRTVGSMGDVGCFSTYIAHFIVAGIGGFATTNDDETARVMRSLMNHGRDNIYLSIDDDQNLDAEQLRQVVARRFSFERIGFNFRATEMEAAIGLGQLEEKDAIVQARRSNAAFFMRELSHLQDHLQLPTIPPDFDHAFMLFPLVLRDAPKTELVNYLESHGVETRDLLPLLNQPAYRALYGDLEPEYPVARWLNRSGFYVGCHQYLTEADREYVASTITDFFRAGGS
jgi:perosamine synthetase